MEHSDEQSIASSAGADRSTRQRLTYQSGVVACVGCKRLKMKCVRSSGEGRCDRCAKRGRDCVTEPQKNASGPGPGPQQQSASLAQPSRPPPPRMDSTLTASSHTLATSPHTLTHRSPADSHPGDPQLAAAANPLALFAEVAEDRRLEGLTSTYPSPHHEAEQVVELLQGGLDPTIASLNLNLGLCKSSLLSVMAPQLFKSEEAVATPPPHELAVRDLSPDLDPTHLGLLSESEVTLFFHTFFSSLHPMNPTLCPLLHTPTFVRQRSMLLFSAICFIGSLYTPESGAATKRLRFHVERLVRKVVSEGYRSLEIVQAFVTYQCWQPPPAQPSEDRLWVYTSLTVSMATELHLDRLVPAGREERLAVCKDDLVNLNAQDVSDNLLSRLVRNRERAWLRLFLWHSAVAVACGSPSMISDNALLRNFDWWNSPLASQHDRITSALVELRLSFIDLSIEIKWRLQQNSPEGTAWIAHFIDAHLDPWKDKWLGQGQHTDYLLLIHRHGRLWLLSAGLDTRYRSAEERQACIADCLSSALDCCKRGLDQLFTPSYLWYLTNSGVVMLAYSASLALRLFSCQDGFNAASSHVGLLGLVASLALTLDRMGSTPSHRCGVASLYGKQLQRVIRKRAFALRKAHQAENDSLLMPNLDDLVMSNMSDFVDGSWDWLWGNEGAGSLLAAQSQPSAFEWNAGGQGSLNMLQ